jgi:acetylornithine/succinyldiaminopimelate/putrescine aminotransferase/predicted amino acid dehydrogenase
MSSRHTHNISYFKPNIYAKLKALNLDIEYHKGVGNSLFFNDENGKEREVKDFLGGFGSLFFGHNHPELLAVANSHLNSLRPFAVQGSLRTEAGKLAEELRVVLAETIGRDYMFSFCNTGTETVEAGLKHARLVYSQRMNELSDQLEEGLSAWISKFEEESGDLLQELSSTFNVELSSVRQAINFLHDHNVNILKRKPARLALNKGFHGKTSGSLQLTHFEGFKDGVLDPTKRVSYVEPEDKDELTRAFKNNVAQVYTIKIKDGAPTLFSIDVCTVVCFIVEPLQGEGGIHVLSREYIQHARELTRLYNVPLMFDEIQCGMGRTGTFLFAEQLGVMPDYIFLSKSFGGGLCKIGVACIAEDFYGDKFDAIHSSTFAEDDYSCSVARKALSLLTRDDELISRAKERGNHLLGGLREIQERYPDVLKEIRGIGLMIGIELNAQTNSGSGCLKMLDKQDLLGYIASGYLLHEHFIRVLPCLSNNNTIRIEPSAYITVDECNGFIAAIEQMCKVIYRQNIYGLTRFIIDALPEKPMTEVEDYRKPPIFEADTSCTRKVAFIGHFVYAQDLVGWDDGFSEYTEAELEAFLRKIFPIVKPFRSETKLVKSDTGATVEMNFLGFPVTSDMMVEHLQKRDTEALRGKLQDGIELAKSLNCTVMGFGGYNSIVSNNCKALKSKGLSLTTGNSYTTAIGLDALLKEAKKNGIDVDNATFAATGAGGNICSVYSEILSERVAKVILIGREGGLEPINKLAINIFKANILKSLTDPTSIGKQLLSVTCWSKEDLETVTEFSDEKWLKRYREVRDLLGDKFPIKVTADLMQLRFANMIVAASNSPKPLIAPAMIGNFPVVICDVALPPDVDPQVANLPDVSVIQGGIVQLPNTPDYKIAGINLPAGTAYACMSETLLLGLDGAKSHYSYGTIKTKQVRKIMDIAKVHGFAVQHVKMAPSF